MGKNKDRADILIRSGQTLGQPQNK